MADLLVRNLSADVVAALDAGAAQLGISRNEFMRRRLSQELPQSKESVTEAHLRNLLQLLPDLADANVMDAAWR
ncbi:antitoxin VapB2 [mine drainage metagenome]|uniref:Antitoxin VapB2 n=1 Tax=mine drainage metagenome TaxID=410659 RepID=A0A1J5Q886_9ZZZZ